jgi:Zn-dependent M28 family amino/carboxypeptidase
MDAVRAFTPTINVAGFMQALAGGLGLAILAALAWLALAPPDLPAPSASIASAAWAARVKEHGRVLAASPRPIAGSDNARARAYLVTQLRAMGLAPAVQRATVRKSVIQFFGSIHHTIGVVHNVVVTIPGAAPDAARRPALLLATHYDSGNALRDADRGTATASALLETARALRAAPPANDVVLLFADGEQVGKLGAQAFVEQHPLAARVGLALKFDGAVDGPLRMLDASGAGGPALAGWMRAAPEVRGASLTATLAQLVPYATTIGPLARLDAPVLLFGGGEPRAAGVAPSNLGDAMLRLARSYGAAPLARGTQPAHVYFALPIVGPVHHAAWLVWVPTILSCLMLGNAWRQFGQDGAAEAAQGMFGVCFLLLVVRVGSWNWRGELAAAGIEGEHRLPLLVAAIAFSVFVGGLYLLRRSVGTAATVLGALVWPMLALIAAAVFLPTIAPLLAWPLVAALGAFTLLHTRWGERQGFTVRLLVLLTGMAPAVSLLLPALRDAWLLLAPGRMYVPPMLMALPMLCFASPLLVLRIGPAVAGALVLVVAGCLALPAGAVQRDAQPVAPEGVENLVYYKDMNTWRAYWLLPQQPLGDWRRELFPGRAAPTAFVEVFGLRSTPQWYAVAPRDDAIAFPECFILLNRVGKVRLAKFTVRSKNRAPHIALNMVGAKALRSRLDGMPLTSKESVWSLSLYGMEDRVLQFEIESEADDIFAVTVQEHMPGLPRHLLPPRGQGVAPQVGSTMSTDILRFY